MDLWYLSEGFYNNIIRNRLSYMINRYNLLSLRVSLGNMGNNELFEMPDNRQIGNKYLI